MATPALTYYDKHHDRDKPVIGGLRIVQVRDYAHVWNMGFCDVGTATAPCMSPAVVMLQDEDHHAFLVCERHNRERMEAGGMIVLVTATKLNGREQWLAEELERVFQQIGMKVAKQDHAEVFVLWAEDEK